MTIAQHSARTLRQESKPGWFARLRESLRATAPENDDWTQSLKEIARPEPQPTHTIVPPQRQAPTAPRPPMALPPRPAAHTLAFMMHRLADLLTDPNLTASKAMAAMQEPNAELNRMFLVEQEMAQQAQATNETLARRSARNTQAAAAAAHGLEVALATPGVRVDTAPSGDGDFVPDLGILMVQQAAHASDTTVQTGYLPKITADMPDPRLATVPADVNEGDVEPAVSPVHVDGRAPIPEPSVAFLAGEGLVPAQLPRRPRPRPEPEAGLAHEVHAPGPVTVLPVQGVERTAVMPAVEADADDD